MVWMPRWNIFTLICLKWIPFNQWQMSTLDTATRRSTRNLRGKWKELKRNGLATLPTASLVCSISLVSKVKNILKGSMDSIPLPSPSVKIQIIGGKVCLRCKGKTLLSVVNKLFVFKSLLTMHINVLLLHLKQTFLPIIWIYTEGEGNGIESRLPFKVFLLQWWTRTWGNFWFDIFWPLTDPICENSFI